MPPSEFGERQFEFAFNSEFARTNATALMGTPLIPTPREEKNLGFDVDFQLKLGGVRRSLFLQHKVAYYAAKRAGRNGNV